MGNGTGSNPQTQMDAGSDIPKQFDYKNAEARIFALWEQHKIFQADISAKKPPFCVVIPPPNVTGILHMGHVLDNVPQDIMTRWHRMRGFAALWIPGTDHAGIATQSVVKKKIQKEGKDFKQLGREGFLKEVWDWKNRHGDIIISQLKRLGCSCDWERERFTMDKAYSAAVLTAFVKYYERGLIYKGKRMINWCTVCGTALANDEVDYEIVKRTLSHFRYPLVDAGGKPGNDFIVVATTRPETMLGDTAVAVHPDDDRYRAFIGKHVLLPLQNRQIPIIADSFVDPAFGSGAVKVTPAHDPNDYRMGLTHSLAIETVVGEDGRMTPAAGEKYSGMSREEARKAVLADLEALGLVEKIEPYSNPVGQCYRCQSAIEPLISDQWFVKMRPLAEKAAAAVRDGRLRIVPESEKHDYFHWMDTIEDWCISRQLWWGHRIPVYYCRNCPHMTAALEAPQKCPQCGGTDLYQDEDVLDTWFSSQLWPFATLGWPEKTKELDYWFPNTWLMSGRDILFFWDSRMIMASLELLDQVPFKTLALHGLVRDEHGRKLSKSLGNSPDPLKLFDQHGTDAVRAAIALHYPMGRQDTRLGEQFYRRGEGLVTKLWNASRLILMHLSGRPLQIDLSVHRKDSSKIQIEDRWVLAELGAAIGNHDRYLNDSDFSHSLEVLNNFFWNTYCDWYLEIIKPRLRGSEQERDAALKIAFAVQLSLLKLLHPYIPFVTEELWQTFRAQGISDAGNAGAATIALEPWPKAGEFAHDNEAVNAILIMQSVVRAARDVRAHLGAAPKATLHVRLGFNETSGKELFLKVESIAKTIGFLEAIDYNEQRPESGYVPFKFDGGMGFVRLPPDVKVGEIKTGLANKIAKLEKAIAAHRIKLNDSSFVGNAPPDIVEQTRKQEKEFSEALATLRDFYASI